MAKGTWLKRFIVGLIAAVSAVLFTKKKVMAPGGSSEGEFKLAPVPDARASGPEDATPLTEEEQKMMAERAPDFKGFSAPPRENVKIDQTPGPEEATPLTEEEQAAFAQRLSGGGSADTPPPISYEISKLNAEEAARLREAGDIETAEALEQRVYFTAPETAGGDVPPPISHEIAQQNADEAAKLREAGDTEGADARDQRIYFAAPTDSEANAESDTKDPGDTTPEPTSEAFDVATDGADHTGQDAADIEDPTSVGLDIDVDLEDDDDTVPELTSEAFDGGEEALSLAAGQPENAARGFITVPDEQDWCPDEFPIKGNASSRIYHKPGESSYDATNPEICFATDEAAAAQGFRPRKR